MWGADRDTRRCRHTGLGSREGACPVEPGPGPRKRSGAPTQKLPEKWTDDQAFWVLMETSYTVSTKSLATVTAWASRPSARPPRQGAQLESSPLTTGWMATL